MEKHNLLLFRLEFFNKLHLTLENGLIIYFYRLGSSFFRDGTQTISERIIGRN